MTQLDFDRDNFAAVRGARFNELQELLAKALDSPELTEDEKKIVRILGERRGAASAIKSSTIAEMLRIGQGEHSRRWICQVIETLVLLHKLPIGASRVTPAGYFLIETQADLDIAINARWKEVQSHFRYLRALTSKQDVARLFGQAQLELDQRDQNEVRAGAADYEKGYGHGV